MDDAVDPVTVRVADPIETSPHALIGSQVNTDALGFTRRMNVAALPIKTDHREVARQTTDHGPADEAAACRSRGRLRPRCDLTWPSLTPCLRRSSDETC